MFNLGTGELVIIFLILLLLFGGKRLPGLARGFGKSLREFRGALEETKDQINNSEDSDKN
ncbi:MAG: twin-arginine translocase TatA/TatE family subunit [Bacteroidota bacterium]|jgi:sec-independent protein translocase protein TatA